mgnify:CR=1 FL=1
MKRILFWFSLTLNVVLLIGWFFNTINSPSKELGRLEKDLRIGVFTGDSVLFTLPKGLTVRNASGRGLEAIGQFENERFEIVITSDDWGMVNYGLPSDSLGSFGNYYCAEIKK